MTVNALKSNYIFGTPQRLCCIKSCPSNATSALVGGRSRSVSSRSIITRTAQRDDVEENEQQRANKNLTDAEVVVGTPAAGANSHARKSFAPSSPFSFNERNRLPNLSCNMFDSVTCLSVRGIDDPYSNDSLDLKIFQYMAELVRNGTSQERASEVISQWSGGKGLELVDLRKLRSHFMQTTLTQVAQQHAAAVVVPLAATCLSYWSLGQLPATDDAILPPAVRGALVAVNLLLLMYFASGSLKRAGRVIRVGRAAWEFSSQAELVLLAMWDLAQGHGPLIQAALGLEVVATPARSVVGFGERKDATWAVSPSPPASAASIATATAPRVKMASSAATSRAAVAAQRHSSRTRVLDASCATMRHVKRQVALSKLLLSSSSPSPSSALPGSWQTDSDALPCSGSQKHSLDPNPPASSSPTSTPSPSPLRSSSSSSLSLPSWEPPSSGPGASLCPPTPPPSPTATPLSSLDSYLVLQEAATLQGGFDAVSELGLSPDEAAAAAAMYARYRGSAPNSHFGDYELRRLLQEAGVAKPPLTTEERLLLMLIHCKEPPSETPTRPGAAGAKGFVKGRCKGWLTFAEWAAWWAATREE